MIQLISCGYNVKHWDGVTIDRPAGAGNYAFVFFKNKAELILDGKLLAVEKNSYILFRPATPHLYRELEIRSSTTGSIAMAMKSWNSSRS